MAPYTILIFLISMSAGFAYINHRFIKMPFVIGLFFLSTIVSLLILSSRFWSAQYFFQIKNAVAQTDISHFILQVMLGFLLFAGSLHTSWADIRKQLKQITLFAIGGVVASTIIIAVLFSLLCHAFNLPIDFIYCLLFGALISPTDPIAVLGILTKANVPKKIETIIVGESLFNDGVGVVVFLVLLESLEPGSGGINYAHAGLLFLQEAGGGIVFGLALGFLLRYLVKSIDHYETEVLLTIAFVMAGYSICSYLHVSGPLAMVVLGLMVGSYKKELMSDITQEYVHKFWELVDVVLNAFLFILVALVMVVIDFTLPYIIISIIAIVIVLFSRVVVVYLPKMLLPRFINLTNREAKLVVWGGLRGGLSMAMVLSLPESNAKNILLMATYSCVLFSILVQGLTIARMVK